MMGFVGIVNFLVKCLDIVAWYENKCISTHNRLVVRTIVLKISSCNVVLKFDSKFLDLFVSFN